MSVCEFWTAGDEEGGEDDDLFSSRSRWARWVGG